MKRINNNCNYKLIIMMFTFLFTIGVTSGVYLNKLYPIGSTSIKNYISKMTSYYSNSNFDIMQFTFLNIKNDFIYLLSIYLCTLLVFTYILIIVIIFLKGLSIGYTINTLILTLKASSIKGIFLVLMKNILIIPFSVIVIILSLNYIMEIPTGIKFYTKFKNSSNIRKAVKKYSINMISLFLLIIMLQSLVNIIGIFLMQKIF